MPVGFTSHSVDLGGNRLNVRIGGRGRPLLMLHGFPQNSRCWDRIAPDFSRHFKVIAPDLRGSGRSFAPADDGRCYSDRAQAAEMMRLLARLGHRSASVLGHDRGAQVAFRMALDHPATVTRLGVIEAVPAGDQWDVSATAALGGFHAALMAQPAPLPERLIGADPQGFVDTLLTRGTAERSLFVFDPGALSSYREQAHDPARVAAACADHRAAAGLDRRRDRADAASGRRLSMPVHLLTATGPGRRLDCDARALWSRWAPMLSHDICDGGHFLPEENPDAVVESCLPFFLDRVAPILTRQAA